MEVLAQLVWHELRHSSYSNNGKNEPPSTPAPVGAAQRKRPMHTQSYLLAPRRVSGPLELV